MFLKRLMVFRCNFFFEEKKLYLIEIKLQYACAIQFTYLKKIIFIFLPWHIPRILFSSWIYCDDFKPVNIFVGILTLLVQWFIGKCVVFNMDDRIVFEKYWISYGNREIQFHAIYHHFCVWTFFCLFLIFNRKLLKKI